MNCCQTSIDYCTGHEWMSMNWEQVMMNQYQLAIEASLSLLLEQYCLCTHELNSSSTNDISTSQSALSYKSHETSYDKPHKTDQKAIKTRRRRNILPNLDSDLLRLLEKARNGDLEEVFSEKKLMKSQMNKSSRRSSQYIGVSKNGDNWQSLINHGHSKKYIGTYSNEIEAAIAYDFFAIALQGSKSRINFKYNCEILADMINSYFEDARTLNPNKFVSRLL